MVIGLLHLHMELAKASFFLSLVLVLAGSGGRSVAPGL
jgi:hypothetical protein